MNSKVHERSLQLCVQLKPLAAQTLNTINLWHYTVGETVLQFQPLKRQYMRMLQKVLLMLHAENNLNKSGLPYLYILYLYNLRYFDVSMFLEAVWSHLGEFHSLAVCFP